MAKKYAVHVEDGEVISVEVDGKKYPGPEQIADPRDRAKIERMIDGALADDEDFAPAEPAGATTGGDPTKIILGVFLGVAALMLLITAIAGFFAAQRMGREQQAQGTVVEMVRRSDSESGAYYYPVVAYLVQGKGILTVELPTGSYPPAYEVGEVLSLRYDPRQPGDVRVQSPLGFLDLWILPLITGFLGVAFLGAVLMVRWITKKEGLDAEER